MDEPTIQYVADGISRVSASRLLSLIDRYLRGFDTAEGEAVSFFRRPFRKTPADHRTGIEKESREMTARCSRCADELLNIRFAPNGRCKGVPELEDRTRRCFGRIRRQQMGLMTEMAGEVRIIGDMIQQAEKMQRLTRAHFSTLSHTRRLMDVIRERFARRPTTLLRLQGRDRGIADINQTFADMNASENAWNASLAVTEQDGAGGAEDPIRRVNAELFAQIRQRGQRIRTAEKELKQGTKLLVGLARNGYSDRLQHRLNDLAARHEARIGDFLRQVDEARRSRPRH